MEKQTNNNIFTYATPPEKIFNYKLEINSSVTSRS